MRQLIFLTAIFFLAACGDSGKAIKPVKKELVQAVYASGKIYPLNNYKVSGKLSGYVQRIHVKIGDRVLAGDPLITIENLQSDLNVSSAKNLYELAQQNVRENEGLLYGARQDVASARTRMELDSLNFARFSNLLKDNSISQAAYDQAKTQYQLSRQQYVKMLNTLENTRQRVGIELRNARNQYESQMLNKRDYTIYSVITGKVYDMVPEEGQMITPGMTLLEVGDANIFEVDLDVDETDITLLKPDQEVIFMIDAYEDMFFKGRVLSIYPRISPGNKTSKVVASLDAGSRSLYSGMSVEANIVVARKKDALVIPREYLIENRKVKLKNGELVTIKKGAQDLESVEVLAGIGAETEIVKPDEEADQ